MPHDDWNHHRAQDDDTRHSKEDALDDREYELLWEGCNRINGHRGLEAQFVIVVAGRLGLRCGEIAHLSEDWMNWRDKRLEIPAHVDCDRGRDGAKCGSCRQKIQQTVEHNDGVEWDDVSNNWWRPKTEAAVRGIPWGWCARAEIVFERFFDEYDRFERSATAISRRVKNAADEAPELNPDDIYPHALRSTTATMLAGKGLGPHALCSMMGWAQLQTAQVYIARSDENTQRAVRSIHSQ